MRAAVYARVSSEDQQERRTIETQLEFARKYCDLHQIDVVEWYQDDGVSGTIPMEDREAGTRALNDAKAGKYQLLLVYKLDRLGRSARIVLNAVHELEQSGVKIRSMTEPFDTGDPSGRFLLTILAGVADLERETILERMWYGTNRAAREGKWLGGIVPYGYRVNDEGYLEINEDLLPGMDMSEAEVVRLIYRLIAEQRYSTIRVADYLNSLGVPPAYKKDGRKVKRGKRKVNTAGVWTPSRIRNMIVNTTYKGIHLYGKRTNKQREIITREVPAIVSSDQWEKAQKALKDNHLEAMRNAKRKYLLRGLIKCGLCGLNYCGTQFPGPGRKPKVYYVCNGKTTYRGKYMGKCPSKNIPAQWIEEMVWKQCVDFITNPGDAIKELAASLEERKSGQADLEAEERMIRKAIEDKEKEKQQILDLYRKQLITSADVEEQLLKIAREKEVLRQQAAELTRKIEMEKEMEQQFNNAEELLADLRSKLEKSPSFEDRRQIVKTLVREIRVNTETDEKGKLQANVSVNFTFSHVVNCTDKHAENNFDLSLTKQTKMCSLRSPYYDESGKTPAARIRLARIKKGLSIKELSKITGISTTSISKIENNHSRPSLPNLRIFAQVLDVPIAFLGCFENLPEQTIGQRIRKARLYHGFTKEEFAQRIGVNEKTLRKWEIGYFEPLPHHLDALVPYFKVLNTEDHH